VGAEAACLYHVRDVRWQDDIDGIVERALAALNALDPEALADLTPDEVELHSALSAVEGRIYRGREGLREYFSDMKAAWSDIRWELAEIIGSKGDNLALVLRVEGHGRGSGAPFQILSPQVWTFRDNRPWRNVVYPSRKEAIAAAGLEREA
jgi:ketosteroid isomerase-like protein